jgi:hypothetical protein
MPDRAPLTGPTPADPVELSADTWELLQEAMAHLEVDNPDVALQATLKAADSGRSGALNPG